MKAIRLDKFLADMGKGSRSQVKQELKKGRVTVNGIAARIPEQKIDPQTDQVLYDGELVSYRKFAYYMLNKPAGVVSATEDSKERTVLDLLGSDRAGGLFPVGRLDKDTEGLLLITDDGALAHRLLHPKKHVDKTYFAKLEGTVTQEIIDAFAEGVSIGDEKPTLPARLTVLENGPVSAVEITICEGRFHQIKRMAKAVGVKVLYLKRLSMGPLRLDPALPTGQYRTLSETEIELLLR